MTILKNKYLIFFEYYFKSQKSGKNKTEKKIFLIALLLFYYLSSINLFFSYSNQDLPSHCDKINKKLTDTIRPWAIGPSINLITIFFYLYYSSLLSSLNLITRLLLSSLFRYVILRYYYFFKALFVNSFTI